MYRIIDFETKKYTTGGTDSKQNAEWLNKLLEEEGLKKLGIYPISAEEEIQHLPSFIKSSLCEIGIDVEKRIKNKKEN